MRNRIFYKTVKVDNLDIFYREAGSPDKPAILLLHGFPTFSFMFRNLISELKDKYHLVAPDYPGFGYSSFSPKKAHWNTAKICRISNTTFIPQDTSRSKNFTLR
jgi:pimeloyl-ACP methyl ester carboxylesterase